MKLLAEVMGVLVLAAGLAASPAAASGKPAKPSRLRVVRVTTSAMGLSWRDRATNERRYRLRFRRATGGSWHRRTLRRNAHRYAIQHLVSATLYVAQVKACNSRGCSRWTRQAKGATLATNLGLCSVFPPYPGSATDASAADNSAWNQNIASSPADATATANIVPAYASHLHPDFGEDPTYGIPYVVVPGSTPKLQVNFRGNGHDDDYGDQSDPGPYAIPPNAPIEGGGGGDSHVIAFDRDHCLLYELYNADFDTAQNRWNASSGVIWHLNSAALRQDGWTSADASGSSIFAGLVKYSEVAAGSINHAIRVTFNPTRNNYIHPASHCAGSTNSLAAPPEGMRFRLKSSYSTAGLTGQAAVIATALKQYGMIVADNGGDWFITGDGNSSSHWDDDQLNQLKAIPSTAFEVVQSAASPSNAGC